MTAIAPRTIELIITDEDIACGTNNPDSCPIALAAKRKFPGSKPRVGWRLMQLYGKCYPLPAQAREFAESFDVGMRVVPFRFSLNLEESC